MTTPYERIRLLMDRYGFKKEATFADSVGAAKRIVYDIRNGHCGISKAFADKIIATYPEVDREWLLNGKEPEEIIKTESDHTIPVIPMDAAAGVIGDYCEGVTTAQCERMIAPVAGADCAIRVYGESMTPDYPTGSTVILKKVTTFIEWGKTYVLDTIDGPVIKNLYQEDADSFRCESINPKYPPFTLPRSAVRGVYRVLLVMIFK